MTIYCLYVALGLNCYLVFTQPLTSNDPTLRMFVCRTCPCVWCLNFCRFCLRSQVGIAGGNFSKKILEIIIIFRSRIYPKDQKRLTDLDFRLDFLFFEKIQSNVEFMQNSDWETNNNKYAPDMPSYSDLYSPLCS